MIKKTLLTLLFLTVFILSSCAIEDTSNTEMNCYTNPNQSECQITETTLEHQLTDEITTTTEKECLEGMHLEGDSCVNNEITQGFDFSTIFDDNETINSVDEIQYILNELINKIEINEDFSNTGFQTEISAYSPHFNNNGISDLLKSEIISFDFHDVIFDKISIKADYIKTVLVALNTLSNITEEKEIYVDNKTINFIVNSGYFVGFVKDNKEGIEGIYKVEINEESNLIINVIDKSGCPPFSGNTITYMSYIQGTSFHERRVKSDSSGHYYFEYFYQNDIDYAYTNVVTNIPEWSTLDVARSERYFNDNYYLVISKSTNVDYKYFTLFQDNEVAVSVEKLESDNNAIDRELPGDKVFWNLRFIEEWNRITINKVFLDNTEKATIDSISLNVFPYFGPSILISEVFADRYTTYDILNPLGKFTFDISGLTDVSVPENRLEEISDMLYVDEETYTIYDKEYQFSDGLLFLIEDAVGIDYYSIFMEFIGEDGLLG